MDVRGLAIVAVLLVVAGTASAADFEVDVEPGQAPTYQGPDGLAELADWSNGTRYVWNLSLPDGTTVGTFRLHDVFEVDRIRQIVPRVDDAARHADADHLHPHHFAEVPRDAIRDGPTYAYNASVDGSERVLRLAFTGAGPATLEIVRDVSPPQVTVHAPTNVTDHGFTLVAETDEPALGTVLVSPLTDGPTIDFPTPNLAYRQRFPVQGLDPDTRYTYEGRFHDWADNQATTPAEQITTAPAPDLPGPPVEPVAPRPDETLPAPVDRIVADVGNASVPAAGVRLFVDKVEVHDGFTFTGTRVRYRPSPPLPEGLHAVRVEAVSDAGGVGDREWRFTVAGESTPSVGAAALVGAAGAALWFASRRGREP